MFTSSMKTIIFAFHSEPYRRKRRLSSTKTTGFTTMFLDAADLCASFRGMNWEWSKGCYIPPSSGTPPSLWKSLIGLILFDFLHYYVQSLSPTGFGSPNGGSVWMEGYPPLQRYFMSTYVTFLAGIVIYLAIDIPYAFHSLLGINVLGQKPEEWPPVSDCPWKATSLTDFWGRRWHQLFRFSFVGVGYKPFAWATGGNRAAGVMGAFIMSAFLHYLGAWGQYPDVKFWQMGGFFILMGVGIVLERGWQVVTGRKVQGAYGAIWTFAWLLSFGQLAANAWGMSGMMASEFYPDWMRPSYIVFGRLH